MEHEADHPEPDPAPQPEATQPHSFALLGGSWVVISGFISRVAILITHIRGLTDNPLITTHEPPSTVGLLGPYAAVGKRDTLIRLHLMQVCAQTQRDVSIASSVTVAEEVTSQRSLRHLNAILTEMAVDTDTRQHSDLGDARMPDVPGTSGRAEEGFSQVRDLARDSSGDVQDTEEPKPKLEQLKDLVGRFFPDDSTEGGSSLAADATMEPGPQQRD